jgi:hypothetical protein
MMTEVRDAIVRTGNGYVERLGEEWARDMHVKRLNGQSSGFVTNVSCGGSSAT